MGLSAGLCGAVTSAATNPAGSSNGDEALWREVEAQYDKIFVEPANPVPVEHLIMPWEKTRAVVLVLPVSQLQDFPGVQRIIRDLLAALLPHVQVIALHDELDYRLMGDWLRLMEGDPAIAPYMDRLELLSCNTFSIWARDFCPLFAVGEDGSLVAIDSSFIDTRRLMNLSESAKTQIDPALREQLMQQATLELKGMRGSDRVPGFMAAFMKARWQASVSLARTPLYLLGGDILPVSHEAALVSSLTLAENGGNADALSGVFRDYYGLQEIVYLENLPGDTIEHLDFIVQPVGEKTILIAQPPGRFGGDRAFHRALNRELSNRLERNRNVLAERFPQHTLVDIPMPPPLLDSDEDVVNELFFSCIANFATSRGIEPMDPRLVEALKKEFSITDLDSQASRRLIVSRILNRPVDQLIARHVEEHVYFRSYVNSLYLKVPDGTELVLVPRYRADSPAEEPLLMQMEIDVEAAYKKALPQARLHWIDCTELAGFMGAVHCLTATVPEID